MESTPPATEGWTLTVYDRNGALVANSMNRYQLTNESPLTRNADGSADIYLQAGAPSDPRLQENWRPTPNHAAFEVIWRLLAPNPADIRSILDGSGWQPPPIRAVPRALACACKLSRHPEGPAISISE